MEYPSALAILEQFGVEPHVANSHDGYWMYQFADREGFLIQLSFNIFEQSVQTKFLYRDRMLQCSSHEGCMWLRIQSAVKIEGLFKIHNVETTLAIQIRPDLSVSWATLAFT